MNSTSNDEEPQYFYDTHGANAAQSGIKNKAHKEILWISQTRLTDWLFVFGMRALEPGKSVIVVVSEVTLNI